MSAQVILVEIKQAAVVGQSDIAFEVEIVVKDSPSIAAALETTKRTMQLFAGGKLTFIRSQPETDTYRDLPAQLESHRCYARFVVVDRPGKWQDFAKLGPVDLGTLE
jgi:hypothetical protein